VAGEAALDAGEPLEVAVHVFIVPVLYEAIGSLFDRWGPRRVSDPFLHAAPDHGAEER
jgi:hypothetical protein